MQARAPGWPVWGPLVVATLVALPDAIFLWWNNPIFSLGLIVLPWAVWYVGFHAPEAGRHAPPRFHVTTLALTVALVLTGLYVQSLWLQMAAVAAGLALVALYRGLRPRAWVAVTLLALTVPPPGYDALLAGIQGGVTTAAATLLIWLQRPIQYDDITITVAGYRFWVTPLCTGVSGLLATTALVGITGVHLDTQRRAWAAALGLAALAAIVLNLVRIVVVVLVTEHFGPVIAEGAFHELISLALGVVAVLAAAPLLLHRTLPHAVVDP